MFKKKSWIYEVISELDTSLFEIAQFLFALERTLILGAMALLNKKSELTKSNFERSAHEQNKEKERSKNGWKRIKMHDLYIF